jgi:DNA-binding MarR family transcriptional regulator
VHRSSNAHEADLLQEIYSAGLLVSILVDDELAKLGLPDQLFSFLGWVSRLQPVTPGELAAETGLPPTTLRDYVRRLVKLGDVRKVPNPDDGRSYLLVLTPQGQERASRGWDAVVAAFSRLASKFERPAADHLVAARELRQAARDALAEGGARRSARRAPADSERA